MSVSGSAKWIATAALFAVALPASAVAQGGPPADRGPMGESRMIRLLDTDRDGKVSLAEITAEQGRLIGASDLDGDGTLSPDEFRRRGGLFQRLGTTTLFDLMDADGDGSLTAEEIAKPSERWFSRYDANSDGQLDAEEVPTRRWRGKHR